MSAGSVSIASVDRGHPRFDFLRPGCLELLRSLLPRRIGDRRASEIEFDPGPPGCPDTQSSASAARAAMQAFHTALSLHILMQRSGREVAVPADPGETGCWGTFR